jgi:hypothetical protein
MSWIACRPPIKAARVSDLDSRIGFNFFLKKMGVVQPALPDSVEHGRKKNGHSQSFNHPIDP